MTTTPTTYQPTCAFHAAGRDCGLPAVAAVERTFSPKRGKLYDGRCKRHAATERNRRYGRRELLFLTPAIVASMEKEANRLAAEQAKERADRDAAQKQRNQQYLARLALEQAATVTWARADREGALDWDATAAALQADPNADHVRLPSIPAWKAVRHDPGRDEHSASVAFEDPRPGRPLRIEVHANTLTLAEAKALHVMLGEAIALAEQA